MHHKNSEKPLYEQFTIQGFWAVSGWTLLFSFSVVPIVFRLESQSWFPDWAFWKVALLLYGIIWIFLFLMLCLMPKLRDK
jgi:hypothetical protein